uniref:threonine/serine exporter family protein n=1 Tax=Thaumasiovibrio occultus TaxID=1891184 RepID=UPI000B351AF1|nr:threonine/serine exporter family protein [Thaumasiovibrio occultus]
MNTLLMMLHNGLFAMIPAVGFAMVFNVPVKALKFCAIGGAVGHMVRYLLMDAAGMSIEMASFIAASCIGFLGVYWSQRFLAHPKVFTVAAIIPMVPGVFAYKAMIALVEINHLGYSVALQTTLVENLLKALFTIAGLALGLALPGLLFYRRRSVV